MTGLPIGSSILTYDSIESTNDLAKHYLESGSDEGLLIFAEQQTQGRGRLGRQWVSLPGLGMYFSFILRPELSPEKLPLLTLMAGLALVSTISAYCPQNTKVKWPNDVLIYGKKVCGILCELCTSGSKPGIVVGIGINVNHTQDHFPTEIKSLATSIALEKSDSINRTELLSSLILSLNREYLSLQSEGGESRLLKNWSKHTNLWGRHVSLTKAGTVYSGKATRLDSFGNLIIRDESGQETAFNGGEVSFRKDSNF